MCFHMKQSTYTPANRRYYLSHKKQIAAYYRRRYLKNLKKNRAYKRQQMAAYRKKPGVLARIHMLNSLRYKPDTQRNYMLKKKYGIQQCHYDEMFEKQMGLCAICKQPETHKGKHGNVVKYLSIDHCHKGKQIRGLLCHHCNSGLGHFRDNRDNLAAAIVYLDKHR